MQRTETEAWPALLAQLSKSEPDSMSIVPWGTAAVQSSLVLPPRSGQRTRYLGEPSLWGSRPGWCSELGNHRGHRYVPIWGAPHLCGTLLVVPHQPYCMLLLTLRLVATVLDSGMCCCQIPMAFALYHGRPIAIHVFRQDALVAQVSLDT